MHSPTRSASLRASGIAAILTAGLVLAGAPIAALADDAGSAEPTTDNAEITETSTQVEDDAAADDAAADEGDPAESGSESDPGESDPGGESEPRMRALGLPGPLSLPSYTVSGTTRDGYGILLASVPVTLNQYLEESDDVYVFTTVSSITSGPDGAFAFGSVPDDSYYLCMDLPDDAAYSAERCSRDFIVVDGGDVTGVRGMLNWRNASDGSDAPTPDNAASLTLTGVRAAGQAVTWNQVPDWSSYTAETGFDMVLGASVWTVAGERPDLQYSPPVEISHQLTAADVTTKVGVTHFYSPDIPAPEIGWFSPIFLDLTLPMPTAPAADSAALRSMPSGGVTTSGSSTEGGIILVTVGADHDGEVVDGWLYSTPTFLGQAVVANGVASFRLPAGMTGSHTVAVSAGGQLIGWASVSIAAGAALAETGASDVAPLAALGALILLAGGALMLTASRRRQVRMA